MVATRDGVAFVNDSKATNPEAAMMALTAFDGGIRLILGGSLKGGSFAELAEAVADGPVTGVYLIGQAAGGKAGIEVQWREIATIFTDIASFTPLVENSRQLAALLNEYMAGMTDIVFAHEGTVAKIIGDSIHVLSMRPETSRIARHARSPARMTSMPGRRNFARAGSPKAVNFGITRIGVHAGPALVGNFGGSRFFDYTAYGDTINTASRLEAANKFLGTRICVSAAVADAVEKFRGGRSAT